jgi:hypothetical protein
MAHIGSKIFYIEYRTEREVGREIHMISIGTVPLKDCKQTSRTMMKLVNNTTRIALRSNTVKKWPTSKIGLLLACAGLHYEVVEYGEKNPGLLH